MLDVHPPHKPLAGFKEFLLHILTITVGLLIATQIESFVEWRHHVHLANEARASLREEIEINLADLKKAAPPLQQWRKEIQTDLANMQRIQRNPRDRAAQEASLVVNARTIDLRNTAWKTAQATGALAYMPYDEAQKYTRIYQSQAQLLAAQEMPANDVARIMGIADRVYINGDKSSPITAQQAGELAEQFGIMGLHLEINSALLNANTEANQAFLEGRAAKSEFSATPLP